MASEKHHMHFHANVSYKSLFWTTSWMGSCTTCEFGPTGIRATRLLDTASVGLLRWQEAKSIAAVPDTRPTHIDPHDGQRLHTHTRFPG